jgi:hypothetical protein
MGPLLRDNWRLLVRHRGLATWLGIVLLRRRARSATRSVVRWALVATVIGALAAFAWWWLHREEGGGDWRREPEPEPAPPPSTPEPAVPVGA